MRRLRKSDQAVNGFKQFRGTARPMPHLAGDEARVDGACPHHTRQRLRDRPRTRAGRIGRIQGNDIGNIPERSLRSGKTANEGDIRRTVEQIPTGIIAGMNEKITWSPC